MDTPPPIPTQHRHFPPPQVSSWPKVLGIITLIVGIFGVINSFFQFFYGLFLKAMGPEKFMVAMVAAMSTEMESEDPEAAEAFEQMFTGMGEMFERVITPMIVGGAFSAILSALMIYGATLLMKRLRKAKMIMQIWAYTTLVLGLFWTFVMHRAMSEMMTSMLESTMAISSATGSGSAAPPPTQEVQTMIEASIAAGSAMSAAMMAIVPIFVLIWFNRSKIKKEIAGDSWH